MALNQGQDKVVLSDSQPKQGTQESQYVVLLDTPSRNTRSRSQVERTLTPTKNQSPTKTKILAKKLPVKRKVVMDDQSIKKPSFCHEWLSVKVYRKTYNQNIRPIPHEDDWVQGVEVVLPPILSRRAGRPHNNRYLGIDEKEVPNNKTKNIHKCGRCGSYGHNKRSCQGGPTVGVGIGVVVAGKGAIGVGRGAAGAGRGTVEAGRSGRGAVGGGRGIGARGGRRGGRGGATIMSQQQRSTLRVPPPAVGTSTSASGATNKKRKYFIPPSMSYMS